MPTTRCSPWAPTPAHVRAAVVAVGGSLASILLGRPDLLVIASPFAAIVAWSLLNRPAAPPTVDVELGNDMLREGESTTWTVTTRSVVGADSVTAVLVRNQWRDTDPASGIRITDAPPPGGSTEVAIVVRSGHWGRGQIGPGLIAWHSAWGAFRSGPDRLPAIDITTLPLPAPFDADAPAPAPRGLVGLNRSLVTGEGTEFASVRPFQLGDRLRRIHWPVSLRTGEIHVAATHTDRDTEVIIVLDAGNDVGRSGGIDGVASSLDLSVRAGGAIAEHFMRRGDRIGLRTFATGAPCRVPAATGARHLRRLLVELARVQVGSAGLRRSVPPPLGLRGGGLVVMLSPMLSPAALQQAVALVRQQLTVVVVDTLPRQLSLGAEHDDLDVMLAWRIRLLEREDEIRRVQELGVPVTAWRGPGSLDHVLRELGRRAGAPRLVRG